MWKDVKYLFAYVSPIAAFIGLYFGGWLSFGSGYVGFILIPVVEFFLPARTDNVESEEEKQRSQRRFFDYLLYLNLPIVLGLCAFYAYRVGLTELTTFEVVAMTINLGIILGTCGINVAHELGHRSNKLEQWISRLLLVPEFYTHFTIEHNYGHHKHVGTPQDPATAKRGEWIYAFWIRSTFGSLINAWKLEAQRLQAIGKPFWGPDNNLLIGLILSMLYLALVYIFAGPAALIGLIFAGIFGFLLLETVNYIEHYALQRKKLDSGRYEPVEGRHSWNSNHELGRIVLYELTRHADHHYKTTRKYQNLRHLDDSPQLPVGYPASLMLALVPPLWRLVMDRRVPVWTSVEQ